MGAKDDLPASAEITGLYEKEAYEIGKAKKFTTTALGRLGAEHKLLQELIDDLRKSSRAGETLEQVNIRKLKKIIKWICRGERQDYRAETKLIHQLERILKLEDSEQNSFYKGIAAHLHENKELKLRIQNQLLKVVVFHNDLIKLISRNGDLWNELKVYSHEAELEKIDEDHERDKTIVANHRKTLAEINQELIKIAEEAEKMILGTQALFEEIERELNKVLGNVAASEEGQDFITRHHIILDPKVETYAPTLYKLLQEGKLNDAVYERSEGGLFGRRTGEYHLEYYTAVNMAYVVLYRENRWEEMDSLYHETMLAEFVNQLKKEGKTLQDKDLRYIHNRMKEHLGKVVPFFVKQVKEELLKGFVKQEGLVPRLLFTLLESTGKLEQINQSEVFSHPSIVFRKFIVLPKIIHYGWVFGRKVIPIFIKASGLEYPKHFIVAERFLGYPNNNQLNRYNDENGLIIFSHQFNNKAGLHKFDYMPDSFELTNRGIFYVGFVMKLHGTLTTRDMLNSCGYAESKAIQVPQSLFMKEDSNKDWGELSAAYEKMTER